MSGRYIMARRSDATSSRNLCSVVVASSQAAQATARAVVAIGTQCARFFSVGEATQTDVAVFCSTGSQTESKYSDVDADILRSGSPCERCNRFFISQNSAEKHWRFKRVDEPLGQPVGKHRCSYCPYSNKIRKSIKGHQKVSSGGEPHASRFCPQQYHPQNAELTVHDSTGDTPYVCSVCQKRFPQKTGLLAHEREHTGAKPYACRICPKTYHGKDSRRLHEKKHARSGELFFCSVCHKSFVYASDLVIHEKVHATMKPYSCRFCPDSFLQSSDLTTHERGHTDERLHVCSVCSKCFPRASQLALHERVHTGDKPYFCTVCSKPFTQIHYLTAHERMHTTEKPYGCIICQKRFALKGSLVKHILGKVGSHCCKKLKRGEHGDKE